MGVTMMLLILAIVIYLTWCLVKYIQFRKIIEQIPGPQSHFLIGNVTQIKYDPEDWQEQAEGSSTIWTEPRMLRVWLFTLPYVCLNGAEEAETVFSSVTNINKAREYAFLDPWLGKGLLTSPGDKWRSRRKLLTPTFHYDILKDFMVVFNKQSNILLHKLQARVTKGEYFDIFPDITLCALDVICESAMGQDVNAQRNKDSKYVRAIYTLNEIIHQRQKRPWLWADWAFKLIGRWKEQKQSLDTIHQFTEKVIKERHEAMKRCADDNGKTGKRMAFLDLILNISEKEGWSYLDVRDEVNTFMFEGHDTTAASMNWTVHLLGCYPEIQEKIFHELDTIFGDDDNRDITFEDLKDMNYLERVIKESLRLYPSVPMFARTLDEDAIIAGRRIPAGVQVYLNPYAIHRDPRHWENPERFDPDRFLPEKSVGRHPYAYVPFSAGSRNCIGQRFAIMEEKTILASILRHYKVKSLHRRDQIRSRPELILRPDKGVHVLLMVRKQPQFDNDNE